MKHFFALTGIVILAALSSSVVLPTKSMPNLKTRQKLIQQNGLVPRLETMLF